jgi:hypothetical protein
MGHHHHKLRWIALAILLVILTILAIEYYRCRHGKGGAAMKVCQFFTNIGFDII